MEVQILSPAQANRPGTDAHADQAPFEVVGHVLKCPFCSSEMRRGILRLPKEGSIVMSDRVSQLLEDKAVLPLELFFDLVFVLGITLTVALVEDGHDARALWRAALVLVMLWWGWSQFK